MGLLNFFKEVGTNFHKEIVSNNVSGVTGSGGTHGIIDSNPITFPHGLGEAHPFDYELIEQMSIVNSKINTLLSKYLDYTLGPGIWVTSKNKKAETIITQWIQDIDFNYYLRRWLKEAMGKGVGFLEMGSGAIQKLKILNANWMYVKRNEYGDTVRYNQFIGKLDNYHTNKVTPFETNEIAMLTINPVGDLAYGIGLVYPLMKTIDNIVGLEADMNKLVKRKANAPIHWKVGFLSAFFKSLPKLSTLTAIKSKLTTLKTETEWVTGPDHDIKVLDYGNVAEKFEVPLNYYDKQYVHGSQIPEVILGSGNIAEGLAGEQGEAFDRVIASIQQDAEKIIEQNIFRRVLQVNGLDDHVEIHWGERSERKINEKIGVIKELLKNPFLDPRLSFRLQQELVMLMKFEEDLLPAPLETSSADKDKAGKDEKDNEENAELPALPGANRLKNQVDKEKELELEYGYTEDDWADYSLKEWLGFNYQIYQSDIQKVLNEDVFELLSAQTQADLEAGLFSTPKIEELRQVLEEGFANELSINEIAKEIDEKVQPGNRYRMKEGQVVYSGGEKVLALSAAYRGKVIARTETIRVSNLAAKMRYEEAGVKEYKWVAAFSDRTCKLCESLNGQVFKITDRDQPPAHVMCRCTIIPVIELGLNIQLAEAFVDHRNSYFFSSSIKVPHIHTFNEVIEI